MSHPKEAARFLKDESRVDWHNETLSFVRTKRDNAAAKVPEWEELREVASAIKDHTLSNLDHYLLKFEEQAARNGIQVHWASDASEHNRIVEEIIRSKGSAKVVKSKSILTEECGLNGHLESLGIEVVDTDLGERIIQFDKKPPSHIVMPAIHMKKKEISEIFHRELQTEEGNEDPQYLTDAARQHLRQKFLQAEIAITGVNFGIAETGGFVVCTNEGNADMGVHLANVHIASMGIEKLIPAWKHLGVFTRLLARSATGQPITNYTSHFHAPEEGKEIHVILVDNGRAEQLSKDKYRNSLKCIRCGACMNTCPIYRRSGGYSYGSTVPGPIGSILSPGMNMTANASLPFASSLCGSCTDVCPVKIDIHEQLWAWRQDISEEVMEYKPNWMVRKAAEILADPSAYRVWGNRMRRVLKTLPSFIVNSSPNKWGRSRDLPEVPKESFNEWYRRTNGKS